MTSINMTTLQSISGVDFETFKNAWIAGGDGLLALDRNGNGAIDAQGELFGTMDTDGFTVLRPLDTNADGKISAAEQGVLIQPAVVLCFFLTQRIDHIMTP